MPPSLVIMTETKRLSSRRGLYHDGGSIGGPSHAA